MRDPKELQEIALAEIGHVLNVDRCGIVFVDKSQTGCILQPSGGGRNYQRFSANLVSQTLMSILTRFSQYQPVGRPMLMTRQHFRLNQRLC